jgi:hypothetical protein
MAHVTRLLGAVVVLHRFGAAAARLSCFCMAAAILSAAGTGLIDARERDWAAELDRRGYKG